MARNEVTAEILVKASPSQVWSALTASRSEWWPHMVFDPIVGSPLIETWLVEGERRKALGMVIAIQPEQLLVFKWAEPGWQEPLTVEVRLTEFENNVQVTVTETGFVLTPNPETFAEEHEASWGRHLENLREYCEQKDIPPIDDFWLHLRSQDPKLPVKTPQSWAFGASPEQADELLELVLRGVKIATSAALWDFESEGAKLPEVGQLHIILDGRGNPRAVIETTEVAVVPFEEVTAEHAAAEGEGDQTLEQWRETHEVFWAKYLEKPHSFTPTMPVVCEQFRLLFPQI